MCSAVFTSCLCNLRTTRWSLSTDSQVNTEFAHLPPQGCSVNDAVIAVGLSQFALICSDSRRLCSVWGRGGEQQEESNQRRKTERELQKETQETLMSIISSSLHQDVTNRDVCVPESFVNIYKAAPHDWQLHEILTTVLLKKQKHLHLWDTAQGLNTARLSRVIIKNKSVLSQNKTLHVWEPVLMKQINQYQIKQNKTKTHAPGRHSSGWKKAQASRVQIKKQTVWWNKTSEVEFLKRGINVKNQL